MLRLDRVATLLGDELMLPDLGDRVGLDDMVNEALTIWASHGWEYLTGRRLTFEVAAGQQRVELGPDVLEVLEAWPESDIYRKLEVVRQRTFHATERIPGIHYICTVVEEPSEKRDTKGEPVPWLHLPADHSFDPNLVVIADMAPARVATESDVIEVPRRFEAAMIGFLRAFARGRFDEDSGGVEVQLAQFFDGDVWQRARGMDGETVNATGPFLGPAGRMMARRGIELDEDEEFLRPRYRR